MYETKVFVIPFPGGSPPASYIFNAKSNKPFSDGYLRSIGMLDKKTWDFLRRGWHGGVTLTWSAYKDYFLERINELGREGWQLEEPFEHPVDEHGWLVRPNDRFETDTVEFKDILGKYHRQVFVGARFLMRRTTFQ